MGKSKKSQPLKLITNEKENSFHNWSQTVGTWIAIGIAVIALYLSFKSYKEANKQFKENTENSKKLFDAQYKIITNQLAVSQKQYNQMLMISKPKIIYNLNIGTYTISYGKVTDFNFELNIVNNGSRPVYNIKYQCFFLNENINIEYKVNIVGLKKLEPGEFSPKTIPYTVNGKETYLYFKISYYDNDLGLYSFQDALYRVVIGTDSFYLANCDESEIRKIKAYIKNKYKFNPLITPDSIEPIKHSGAS